MSDDPDIKPVKPVLVRLDRKVVEDIDAARGDRSREGWIRDVITASLNGSPPVPPDPPIPKPNAATSRPETRGEQTTGEVLRDRATTKARRGPFPPPDDPIEEGRRRRAARAQEQVDHRLDPKINKGKGK